MNLRIKAANFVVDARFDNYHPGNTRAHLVIDLILLAYSIHFSMSLQGTSETILGLVMFACLGRQIVFDVIGREVYAEMGRRFDGLSKDAFVLLTTGASPAPTEAESIE